MLCIWIIIGTFLMTIAIALSEVLVAMTMLSYRDWRGLPRETVLPIVAWTEWASPRVLRIGMSLTSVEIGATIIFCYCVPMMIASFDIDDMWAQVVILLGLLYLCFLGMAFIAGGVYAYLDRYFETP